MKIILLFLFFISFAYASEKHKKSTNSRKIELVVRDVVKKVLTGSVTEKIIFNTHAGVYYLKSDIKNYKSIKNALESSQKKQEEVQLKVNPDTMEIEELILNKR